MTHTPECQAAQEAALAQQEEWVAKWPNYCQKCGGRGVHVGHQSVPYGSTSASFEVVDPCECTEAGKCARCGAQGLSEDGEGPCKACGWNYDDMVPGGTECICPIPDGPDDVDPFWDGSISDMMM